MTGRATISENVDELRNDVPMLGAFDPNRPGQLGRNR